MLLPSSPSPSLLVPTFPKLQAFLSCVASSLSSVSCRSVFSLPFSIYPQCCLSSFMELLTAPTLLFLLRLFSFILLCWICFSSSLLLALLVFLLVFVLSFTLHQMDLLLSPSLASLRN